LSGKTTVSNHSCALILNLAPNKGTTSKETKKCINLKTQLVILKKEPGAKCEWTFRLDLQTGYYSDNKTH